MSTRYSPVRHFNHFRRSFLVRLACVKHAASVRPEPGSNSQVIILCFTYLINVHLSTRRCPDRNRLSVYSYSLFKELAFSSCKPYNASCSLKYCQYFYCKERLIKSGDNSQGVFLYLLLLKIYKGKSKLICIWLLWLILTTMYLSKISASDSARVIISPISVLGKIPIPEQQILFNRFREQINHHYTLVSYRVL